MFAIVALVTVVVFVASVGLALQPGRRHLLIAYAVGSTWVWLVLGYYDATGYLGTGKSWSFLELMYLCLIALAWPTSSPAPWTTKSRSVDRPMMILTALVVLGFLVGGLRPSATGVLGYSKRFLFILTFFVAARILSDPASLQSLYKAIKVFVIPTFILHVLLASGVFVPPLPEAALERLTGGYTDLSRVESLLSPAFYLVALAICLTEILYRRGGVLFNWIIVSLSAIGVLLSQTRSYYLAMGAIVVGALVMLRGRIKLAVMVALGFVLVFVLVEVVEVQLFFRFTQEVRRENAWYRYWHGWRGQEYGILARKFASEPQWLLTGRGFGATHAAPASEMGFVTYFHNQYLKVFNSLGLIGLACHLIIVIGCVFHNRQYAKDPVAGPWLSPARLIFLSIIPAEMFGGFLWAPGTGPLLLCFVAIARNGDLIAEAAYRYEYVADAYEDSYALIEDAPGYVPT